MPYRKPRPTRQSKRVNLQQETEKHWRQWCEKLTEAGLAPPEDAGFKSQLMQVWEASDYVLQSALREPGLLGELQADGELARTYVPDEMAQRLRELLAGVTDEASLGKRLRRYRRRQMVRII